MEYTEKATNQELIPNLPYSFVICQAIGGGEKKYLTYDDDGWCRQDSTDSSGSCFIIIPDETEEDIFLVKNLCENKRNYWLGYRGWTFIDAVGLWKNKDDASLWKFIQVDDFTYKIKIHGDNKWISVKDGESYLSDSEEEASHYQFIPCDVEVVDVKYDLENKICHDKIPRIITTQDFTNDTSVVQNLKFTVEETVTETSTFEHKLAFDIKFKSGMRCGEFYTVSSEKSISKSLTLGTTKSVTKKLLREFPLTANPHTKIKAEAIVEEGMVDIPYTITLRSNFTKVEVKYSGIWKGMTTSDIIYKLTEVTS